MAWYISEIIGDGSNAEGSEFRPALADHVPTWRATDGRADATTIAAGDRMLVRAEPNPAQAALIAADRRIEALSLTASLVRSLGCPWGGETDLDELALKIGRRFYLNGFLGPTIAQLGDDLNERWDARPRNGNGLTGRLRQHRRPLDLSGIQGSTTVGAALEIILPQLDLHILGGGRASPGGTFTDDFNGEASQINLEDRSPSGGTAWTRSGGIAGGAKVETAGNVTMSDTGSTGTAYFCDDQGNAAQYVQGDILLDYPGFPVCNRMASASAFIGCRFNASTLQMYKRVAGSFTLLDSDATPNPGDTIRLESDGSDNHDVYVNGSGTPTLTASDAAGNTNTRQGLNARSSAVSNVLDNFEAGLLSAAPAGAGSFTPAAPSLSASGVMQPSGSASLSLAAPSLAAAGTQDYGGAGAFDAGAAELAASGVMQPAATAGFAAAAARLTATATHSTAATATAAFSALAASLAAAGTAASLVLLEARGIVQPVLRPVLARFLGDRR